MSRISIRVVNISGVFGGQEKYVYNLLGQLYKIDIPVDFEGGPCLLRKEVARFCNDVRCMSARNVRIFNGNRALYHSLKYRKGKEFWVYVHHSDINDSQGGLWRKWLRKVLVFLCLIRFDMAVRVSDSALPDIYALGRIETIYNGVPVPDRIKDERVYENKNLLMVGTVNENKNHIMAIFALKRIPNATLYIVGDGPLREELTRLANNVGVGGRIKWIGFLEDVQNYYLIADALLMLSRFEAFPYVVLEAMSYGVPVISVPVGGVPEIIRDGVNGWLLEDYSVSGLVKKVNNVFKSADEYMRVATAARRTIEEAYTVEHMTNKLLDAIYQRIDEKK